MSDRSHVAHTSPSSAPPPSHVRSRIHLPSSSKLVKKARESRYLGGGGSGGSSDLRDPTVEAFHFGPNRSTTSLEEEVGGSKKGRDEWHKRRYPVSGFEVQRYARNLPYFLSYSNSSRDWDSHLTSMLGSCVAFSEANTKIDSDGTPVLRSPPKRVLDVGCGASHWILQQAFTPGWEETHFFGLDAEPSRWDEETLPPTLAGRFSHVQSDFLKDSLPFDDNSFDYVRIARLGFAVPESKWIDLLEECVRVLSPGSYLEIAEVDLTLYRGNEQVFKILEQVLDHQFINLRPLTVLPSNLTLVGRDMRSTGRLSTRIPSSPSSFPIESERSLSARSVPLRKFAAGSEPTFVNPSTTVESHLALHGYSQWLASSSWGIANAALEARQLDADPHFEDDGAVSTTSTRDKEMANLMETIETCADQLRDRAGISRIVTARFGWEPRFDQRLSRQLEDNLPVLRDRLMGFGRERRKRDSMFGGQQDPEIGFRYQQAELAKRECEHELKAVRGRLEGRERLGVEDDEDLGSMDFEVFIARAP